MHQFDRSALIDIIHGACFLASGGGGPLAGGLEIVDVILKYSATVSCIDVSEVRSEDMIAMIAGLGSPDAAAHASHPFSTAPGLALASLQKETGHNFNYIVPGEIGAMNSAIPLLLSAQQQFPLINGDGAGRAIPFLDMSTFASTVPIDPFVICNETQNPSDEIGLVLHTPEVANVDEMARAIVSSPSFGNEGAFATWAMNGSLLQQVTVAGGLTLANSIGATLRTATQSGLDPVQELMTLLGTRAEIKFTGKIIDIVNQEGAGLDSGRVILQDNQGTLVTVYNMNENLIAWENDNPTPLIMGPDSICYLTTDGKVFSNADISQDILEKDIVLIALKADPKLKSEACMQSFQSALAQIGYAGAYVPFY